MKQLAVQSYGRLKTWQCGLRCKRWSRRGTTAHVGIRKVESSSTDLAAVGIEALQDNRVEGSEGPNFAENRGAGGQQEAHNEEPRPGGQDNERCRLGLPSSCR